MLPDNATYDGAPAELLSGAVNISVCPLAITLQRMKHFQLISGYFPRDYEICVHISSAVDTGKVSHSLLAGVLHSFDSVSWLAIHFVAAIIIFLLWITRSQYAANAKETCKLKGANCLKIKKIKGYLPT